MSTGTIAGVVTNSMTGSPVAGVEITLAPDADTGAIQTGSNGRFSVDVPIGVYEVTLEKGNFGSASKTAMVVAGGTASLDAALAPTSAVAVNAGADQSGNPGASVALRATAEALDGSSISGYQWTQVSGVTAQVSGANSASASATLGNAAAYKAELLVHLNVLDRPMVLGINPFSLEEAGATTFKVTVTTSSGTYSDTVTVHADLPYKVTTGIRNVPTGIPVLLNVAEQSSYSWSLSGPSGSQASLDTSSARNPYFTPDAVGKYTLTESSGGSTIEVFAGEWAGAITGQDANGRPLAANCTSCHNGTIAPDKFTDWKESGHAEIFTNNLNTSGYYGEGCFACHTVGFDKGVENGGVDEAPDYQAFKDAGILGHPSSDNWTTVLAQFPETAKKANIQCENCHGPNNDSTLHLNGSIDAARVSVASEVCAACHGEPKRHARYQQWEESGHANYDLAIAQATVENRGTTAAHCGRCHSGQGFEQWIKQDDLSQRIQGASGNATVEELTALGMTADEVQPQTCATCHKVHNPGKESGEPNDVILRVQGDTKMLPAGFKAVGVGNGALCMTCHNTRNGLHNDEATPTADDRAPHSPAQADVLMGQNAFFVETPKRSPHSFIENTCTTCHMVLTDPPAELSYNLSGTNHTFEPSREICTQCHGVFDGGTLEHAVEGAMEELKEAIEAAIEAEIAAQIAAGNSVVLEEAGANDADVTISSAGSVTALELTESHGRLAMDITVSGTTYEHIQLGSAAVGTGTILSSAQGQAIAKAAWNYFLIHGDASEGVHNPNFIMDVLNASLAALE